MFRVALLLALVVAQPKKPEPKPGPQVLVALPLGVAPGSTSKVTLRGLRLDGAAAPGEPLRLGDKEVGRIGSFCVSPAHGAIALAIVRREAEPGAELAVGEDGVTARVVDLPFG